MTSIVKRYGTVLRIWDKGDRVADRFTICPPRWASAEYREHGPGQWVCLASSAHPFHPQGFGQHASCMPGHHLGRRITWGELPPDAQRFARESFPEFAPMADITPKGDIS